MHCKPYLLDFKGLNILLLEQVAMRKWICNKQKELIRSGNLEQGGVN